MARAEDRVGTVAHRAQHLILAFLGSCVVDRHDVPIPTQAYIDVLTPQGVGESAIRATLARMTERGLLTTDKVGRIRRYALTDTARAVLRRAGTRVFAPQPFAPRGHGWTLMSYSVPESRRELRHQLRSRLVWAGFGPLRDGLWIASGSVDLDELFSALPERADMMVNAFDCVPIAGWTAPDFVREAWDLDRIEQAHHDFIAAWGHEDAAGSAVIRLTALIADWLQLLRIDPRLPRTYLPHGWPAQESTVVFRQAHAIHDARAVKELSAVLDRDRTSGPLPLAGEGQPRIPSPR